METKLRYLDRLRGERVRCVCEREREREEIAREKERERERERVRERERERERGGGGLYPNLKNMEERRKRTQITVSGWLVTS